MDAIFITVKIPGQNEMDLKIPDYITGEDFLAMLSETFGVKLPAHTKIQAEPIGRILENTQALVSEGVETGALLTILQGGA